MNRSVKINQTIILFAALLFGSSMYAQHDHSHHQKQTMNHDSEHKMSASFENEQFTVVYNTYIQIKDALAMDKKEESRKGASQLFELLEGIPNGSEAQKEAENMANSKSLKEQREIFVELSDKMASLVKENELTHGEVYIAHCPMANNNEGAHWLSNEKEIANPYFGTMMSKCGSVKEIIK